MFEWVSTVAGLGFPTEDLLLPPFLSLDRMWLCLPHFHAGDFLKQGALDLWPLV